MKRKVITTAAIAGILLLTLVAMPAGAEDTLEETVNTANASGGSGGSGGSGSG
ncbi:molybdopterin molybdenumtransferase MoeA, partial [Methanosarcinales archaeon]